MDELDAATLANYRRVLDEAVQGTAARGAIEHVFAAIERREARERAAMEIVRGLAEIGQRLGAVRSQLEATYEARDELGRATPTVRAAESRAHEAADAIDRDIDTLAARARALLKGEA